MGDLAHKLSPEEVRRNLVKASVFITAYELMKDAILRNVSGFFISGFDQSGLTHSPEYERDVLSRDKNKVRASLLWLLDMKAITPDNLAAFDEMRKHRNEVAHDLPKLLVDPAFSVDLHLLNELHIMLRRLDRFFGEIEVDTNPDFDGKQVDLDGIKSGTTLLLEYIISIAAEDEA
jgi:hypothetical protein